MNDIFTATQDACRFCQAPLSRTFADLGTSPLCQSQVHPTKAHLVEPFYKLHAYVCDKCLLVQLGSFVDPSEIFSEYAYFSSFSESWLKHAERYVAMMTDRFALGPQSKVVEIASNDGYLLQYFVQRGIPALGIEPAANVAAKALEKGVQSVVEFFGVATAKKVAQEKGQADVLLGNNVLAHVPDLLDFVKGMKILLKPTGVITMEFPHLLRLMEENQFDTIYHEHFSYFSFSVVEKIFASVGITLFDVEELPSHGGSLRIFGRHTENTALAITDRVATLKQKENQAGLLGLQAYDAFGEKVKETKRRILEGLIAEKRQGKSIVLYGAAGKSNTLINYCGLRTDFFDYAVDKNPYKQGHFLPGTRIPVYAPDRIQETKPDRLFIGVWNLKQEIIAQTAYLREWGGKWLIPIPTFTIAE
jgi:SAM-dependent methyltransferase